MDSYRKRWLDGWRKVIFGAGPERAEIPHPKPKPAPEVHEPEPQQKADPLVAAFIRAAATDMQDCNVLTVDDYGVITAFNDSMQSRYETNAHYVDSPELAGHGPVEV